MFSVRLGLEAFGLHYFLLFHFWIQLTYILAFLLRQSFYGILSTPLPPVHHLKVYVLPFLQAFMQSLAENFSHIFYIWNSSNLHRKDY